MPLVDTAVFFAGTHVASSSPDGRHVAVLSSPHLRVYQQPTFQLVRDIALPQIFKPKHPIIRWAPPAKGYSYAIRFLISDRDTALVYDLEDSEWSATITYGNQTSGAIASADFGLDEFEVITFPRFGAPMTIWSLYDGSQTDIKDPKFAGRGSGFSRHGRGGVFALLGRSGAEEHISVHLPDVTPPYSEVHRVSLGKADTMGLKWSPSSKLFATWQAARNGYEVGMHNAEGRRLRVYKGDYFEDSLIGLGVHHVDWDPTGSILVVGAYERSMTLLKAGTMTAAEYLYHRPTITSVHTQVFVEETAPPTSELSRHYQLMDRRPYALPVENSTPTCISLTSFNADGTALATRDDSIPTAAWVWSLISQSCIAVLVQTSKVKSFAWHPVNPDILIIQAEAGGELFYSFNVSARQPDVVALRLPEGQVVRPEVEASWLPAAAGGRATLLLSDRHTLAVAYPEGRAHIQINEPESQADEDSLFDILAAPRDAEAETERSTGLEAQMEKVDLEGSALSAHWREVGAF